MQVPKRRGEDKLKKDFDFHITAEKLERMKTELARLVDTDQPVAAKEVQRTGMFGDFSENAEYKEAKSNLRKILSRIDSLKKRISHAVVIQVDESLDEVQLGSKVVVQNGDNKKVFEIVGASEIKLSVGKISHSSPVGQALLGKKINEQITIKTPAGEIQYIIKEIK
jgi:transcription elongation GreA/GreB family factor